MTKLIDVKVYIKKIEDALAGLDAEARSVVYTQLIQSILEGEKPEVALIATEHTVRILKNFMVTK